MIEHRVDLRCDSLAQCASVATVVASQLDAGDLVLLEGDLGAGKTTWAGFALRSLGLAVEEPVPSPTYSLLQEYPECTPPVLHADFYRLTSADELNPLGVHDYLADGWILMAEWAQRFETALGEADWLLHFQHKAEGRSLSIGCRVESKLQKLQELYER